MEMLLGGKFEKKRRKVIKMTYNDFLLLHPRIQLNQGPNQRIGTVILSHTGFGTTTNTTR